MFYLIFVQFLKFENKFENSTRKTKMRRQKRLTNKKLD